MGKPPLYVRAPTDAEREALEAALRSPDAFVLRRAQILLASARGEQVRTIAPLVGYSGQAIRLVIHAFNQEGLATLQRRPTTPHTLTYCFDPPAAERLLQQTSEVEEQPARGDHWCGYGYRYEQAVLRPAPVHRTVNPDSTSSA